MLNAANSGTGDGIEVSAAGDDGIQVTAANDDGIYIFSAGDNGVYVNSAADYGVYAQGGTDQTDDYGGYFQGYNGVYGYASSSGGPGVTGAGNRYGVHGTANWTSGDGVYGYAASPTGPAYGVNGRSDSNADGGGVGVYGYGAALSGTRYGVRGEVNGSGWGLYTSDNLGVGGSVNPLVGTIFTTNNGKEKLRVGDVVSPAGVGSILQGHTRPVLKAHKTTAKDLSVLGVVYMRGEFYAASGKAKDDGDSIHPVEGDVEPGDYMLVATTGLVQVRLAPGVKGLTPGQKLTASGISGRATLLKAKTNPDLVFGRTMQAEPDESGLVWALINTQ
jgi:hypothetical protein